jgi:sulfite exporter TauE/SafE
MTFDLFLKPILAGLSVGAFCLSYCFPFLAAFITSEERTTGQNTRLIVQFIIGRFLGYMVFGIIFGYLGEQIRTPYMNMITNISLILISMVMILYITGLLQQKDTGCLAPKVQSQNAIVMGFLMGVNICPPFLLSLAYVVSLHDILQSVLYFTLFFIASSIYFLPMIFVGMLGKIKEFKLAARLAGLISAAGFIVYGAYAILQQSRK